MSIESGVDRRVFGGNPVEHQNREENCPELDN